MSRALASRLRRDLAHRLPADRLTHVLGVEGMATRLASLHGVEPERAMLAALLHDYFKAEPKDSLESMLRGAAEYQPTAEDWEHPALWHGFAAARFAKETLGIGDAEVRAAVAHHTMGAESLGPVGLVLYVADYVEPSRKFPDAPAVRRTVEGLPLNKAALFVCNSKIAQAEARGRRIHSRALAMRRWLEHHP